MESNCWPTLVCFVRMLRLEVLDRPGNRAQKEPFAFLVAAGVLDDSARARLAVDFPRYTSAGFFPHEPDDCGPSVNALIAELTAPVFAHVVGMKLGIDSLETFPTLVTICRMLNKRHGTIHTDSQSKIATALLYLNETWPDTSAGCLRFLQRADSIDDQ
ncbi:MAG TPA: hypothetical protein VFN25_07685 [Dokdonella sp.]|uniref:hypothetical protein n=1 Tax=Dokdonella sp. TaxID=2291710 RepID=UPI002D7F91E7|nr:hypothetical protein [Dokdonella sp.]HET9032770.1 hypothetical protein [Dokdonella sp.]